MKIGHEGIRPYVEAIWEWNQEAQERAFRDRFIVENTRIVQVDGLDAGYVQVEEHKDHTFLAGIYLDAAHRGSGVGATVLKDFIERAKVEARPIRLRVLLPNPAQRLCTRLGFRTTSVTDTHVYMEFNPGGA